MYDNASAGRPDRPGRCPICGQRQPTVSNRFGTAVGLIVVLLCSVIMLAPLLWIARVAFEWAAGIS